MSAFLIFGGVMFAVVIVGAVLAGQAKKDSEERRGWRVQWAPGPKYVYQEKGEDGWREIAFDEIGDEREAPHVIDVRSVDRWRDEPAWAQAKREVIIERLRSELKGRDFVLKEG